MDDSHPQNSDGYSSNDRLVYKFQRMREQLREAVTSGELSGKLPGERLLAQRFGVNAKTLSKALTDLAAEGLLERTIGRGTFVRGSTRPASGKTCRWLLICEAGREDDALPRLLQQACPETHVVSDVAQMRPSFLSQFTAVVDLSRGAPPQFLREMVVRGTQVVVVGREPVGYSMNCVLVDVMLGAGSIARDLMTAGHRNFAAVESSGQTVVQYALNKTAERFGHEIIVQSLPPDEVEAALTAGVTAFVCDGDIPASRVMQTLRKLDIDVPGRVSVAAVGCTNGESPCTGYYVSAASIAESIQILLADSNAIRPATLWLVGAPLDYQSTGACPLVSNVPGDVLGASLAM